MRVSENMKIKDVLALGEHMLNAFMWLSPEFERLQHPKLRRANAVCFNVADNRERADDT